MTGGMCITYYIVIPEYVNPLWVRFSGCLTYNDRTVPCTRLLCCHPVYFSGSHGSQVAMMFLTVLFVCLADPLPGKLCRMTRGCLPVQVARLLATEAAAAPQSFLRLPILILVLWGEENRGNGGFFLQDQLIQCCHTVKNVSLVLIVILSTIFLNFSLSYSWCCEKRWPILAMVPQMCCDLSGQELKCIHKNLCIRGIGQMVIWKSY